MKMYGWNRYLSIEKDFLDAQYYIPFDMKDAYSEFISKEIILLGAEIESALKELCKRIDGSEARNMENYKGTILKAYPGIVHILVINKQTNECQHPFKDWNKGRLDWWDVYTSMKHNLVDRNATLQTALSMLQAYELILFCIAASENNRFAIELFSGPKLFRPQFSPSYALMPDMSQMFFYDGKAISAQLKANTC